MDAMLHNGTTVTNNQFSFMLRRSKTEIIHMDLYIVFIDMKRVYDYVPHEAICGILDARGVPKTFVTIVHYMYSQSMTCVRTFIDNLV